jgi:proline-specific peptidase
MMTAPVSSTEGFISFHGYHVWYRIVGGDADSRRLPLLCLHGGPGMPHDYLEPLEGIAATGRRVIFYDQLGCGNSDRPHDPSLWTIALFVEEVGAVRRALGLDRIHLLGQSWGGMLAMEYVLTRPAGLVSLTLASTLASTPRWISEANRLRAELPPEVQATLLKHEEASTTSDPAYGEAMMVFYRRHFCRLDPWPECVERTFERLGGEVYNTMWGPSEFHATGTLRDWDIRHRLGEIQTPTLITSGRHDEATPAMTEAMHRSIPGSEWVIFEHSAHLAHVEEPERFIRVLGEFLERVEAQA